MANSYSIRAIAFDLDGVLIDAAPWHAKAFMDALSPYEVMSPGEHELCFNGLSTRKKLQLLAKDKRIPSDVNLHEKIYNDKQALTVDIIKKHCKPVERTIDVVECASATYNIGVVTNCSRRTAEMMLELSNLKKYFSFIITNEDVNGDVKPHPKPYLEAAVHFNLPSERILAIDDTQKGIQSAKGAGCETWRLLRFIDLSVYNLYRKLADIHIRRRDGTQRMA